MSPVYGNADARSTGADGGLPRRNKGGQGLRGDLWRYRGLPGQRKKAGFGPLGRRECEFIVELVSGVSSAFFGLRRGELVGKSVKPEQEKAEESKVITGQVKVQSERWPRSIGD